MAHNRLLDIIDSKLLAEQNFIFFFGKLAPIIDRVQSLGTGHEWFVTSPQNETLSVCLIDFKVKVKYAWSEQFAFGRDRRVFQEWKLFGTPTQTWTGPMMSHRLCQTLNLLLLTTQGMPGDSYGLPRIAHDVENVLGRTAVVGPKGMSSLVLSRE